MKIIGLIVSLLVTVASAIAQPLTTAGSTWDAIATGTTPTNTSLGLNAYNPGTAAQSVMREFAPGERPSWALSNKYIRHSVSASGFFSMRVDPDTGANSPFAGTETGVYAVQIPLRVVADPATYAAATPVRLFQIYQARGANPVTPITIDLWTTGPLTGSSRNNIGIIPRMVVTKGSPEVTALLPGTMTRIGGVNSVNDNGDRAMIPFNEIFFVTYVIMNDANNVGLIRVFINDTIVGEVYGTESAPLDMNALFSTAEFNNVQILGYPSSSTNAAIDVFPAIRSFRGSGWSSILPASPTPPANASVTWTSPVWVTGSNDSSIVATYAAMPFSEGAALQISGTILGEVAGLSSPELGTSGVRAFRKTASFETGTSWSGTIASGRRVGSVPTNSSGWYTVGVTEFLVNTDTRVFSLLSPDNDSTALVSVNMSSSFLREGPVAESGRILADILPDKFYGFAFSINKESGQVRWSLVNLTDAYDSGEIVFTGLLSTTVPPKSDIGRVSMSINSAGSGTVAYSGAFFAGPQPTITVGDSFIHADVTGVTPAYRTSNNNLGTIFAQMFEVQMPTWAFRRSKPANSLLPDLNVVWTLATAGKRVEDFAHNTQALDGLRGFSLIVPAWDYNSWTAASVTNALRDSMLVEHANAKAGVIAAVARNGNQVVWITSPRNSAGANYVGANGFYVFGRSPVAVKDRLASLITSDESYGDWLRNVLYADLRPVGPAAFIGTGDANNIHPGDSTGTRTVGNMIFGPVHSNTSSILQRLRYDTSNRSVAPSPIN